MGRIKTKQIKRISNEFLKQHGQSTEGDFSSNKVVMGRYTNIRSKKLRNAIVGYVTRLTKKKD